MASTAFFVAIVFHTLVHLPSVPLDISSFFSFMFFFCAIMFFLINIIPFELDPFGFNVLAPCKMYTLIRICLYTNAYQYLKSYIHSYIHLNIKMHRLNPAKNTSGNATELVPPVITLTLKMVIQYPYATFDGHICQADHEPKSGKGRRMTSSAFTHLFQSYTHLQKIDILDMITI
jgi:hypothetical protein